MTREEWQLGLTETCTTVIEAHRALYAHLDTLPQIEGIFKPEQEEQLFELAYTFKEEVSQMYKAMDDIRANASKDAGVWVWPPKDIVV